MAQLGHGAAAILAAAGHRRGGGNGTAADGTSRGARPGGTGVLLLASDPRGGARGFSSELRRARRDRPPFRRTSAMNFTRACAVLLAAAALALPGPARAEGPRELRVHLAQANNTSPYAFVRAKFKPGEVADPW